MGANKPIAVAADVVNINPVQKANLAVGGAGVKSDDRSLLNWGDKAGKAVKVKSPNLEGFNETDYIAKGRHDTDAYKLNGFNQEASDKLSSDRTVPDTRSYQYVHSWAKMLHTRSRIYQVLYFQL